MNGESGGIFMQAIPMVIILAVMYFFMLRPNAKRKKQEDEMRNNIQVGDVITTIGGIVGTVVGIKDDAESFIIETGVDRSKIKIKKWAIASSENANTEASKKEV